MSDLKTTFPPLSDLFNAFGLTDGSNLHKPIKPLCDNIFDVQRSELFETLERLQTAFWSDEITLPSSQQHIPIQFDAPTSPTPQAQLHPEPVSPKQLKSEPDDDMSYQQTDLPQTRKSTGENNNRKRARLSIPAQAEPVKKGTAKVESSSPYTLQTYSSLWPLKQTVIRQIKTATYNESQLLLLLTDIFQAKATDQTRHLAHYLIPIAKAMRRETIVNLLQSWL